jgi:hypothetical protein
MPPKQMFTAPGPRDSDARLGPQNTARLGPLVFYVRPVDTTKESQK